MDLLPEGWHAVMRWEEEVKHAQQLLRPNRTLCGGRRVGATCTEPGEGWLDASADASVARALEARPWCRRCSVVVGGGGGGVVAVERR